MYASSADLDVVDDGEGSLYNADENHKVWNGSQDHLDGVVMENPYDIYSGENTSTLGRPARIRQISAPIPVPPPPKEEPKKKKDKKTRQIGSQSLSGTLIRPRPMHGNVNPLARPPPPGMMYGPMGPVPGPPPPGRQFHTIGHRIHSSHHMQNGHGHGHGHGPPPQMMQMQMQMPMHQVPMMIPPQYATLQHPRTSKKKKNKDKHTNGIPIGMPIVPPMFAYPPPPQALIDQRPLSMSNRKLAQSAAAGLDEPNSGDETPGGTGIYRRKGHLNERAFSYSIRQEHRSRSHGSLASLQFNPPDMKKEREIAQMVAGLELNDDSTLRRRGMSNDDMMPGSSGTFGKPRR